MYSKNFAKIYSEYDWDYFSITMFNALEKYFDSNNISIETHMDIACGIGTLCNCFHEKGIETAGIDLSSHMISIAKKRYPKIDFKVMDMTNLNLKKQCDLITCTCDALNHLNSMQELKNTINNVYNHLNKGGLFVFDIIDPHSVKFNEKIISKRKDNIDVEYLITINKENFINTNIIVKKSTLELYEENIKEILIDQNKITNILQKRFNILLCSDNISGENQRFKDKIYFICSKI